MIPIDRWLAPGHYFMGGRETSAALTAWCLWTLLLRINPTTSSDGGCGSGGTDSSPGSGIA
jgi:hypothetical protein